MSQTTAQAMSAFLLDISVTEYQKTSIIEGRKSTVVANLTKAFPTTCDMPFSQAILMGSAAKGTIVRPIDDVDVLVVFSNERAAWDKYRWDSRSFIYRIRQAYSGLESAQVGTRGQAVRVFFQTGGHVDVAPVFSYGDDTYALPNGEGGWISTAPTKANAWFANRNAALDYHLAPLVRLLKKWNLAHSSRMRSFHLETVAATAFQTLGSNYRDALARFFEWSPMWLDVADPGGQSGSLSSYLSWGARPELMTSLKAAAERSSKALEAEAAGNHDEAKRLWRMLLGSAFPD